MREGGKEVRATATTPTTMPAGNTNPRLDAVLRAGHAKFAATGKNPPANALMGPAGADAIKEAKKAALPNLGKSESMATTQKEKAKVEPRVIQMRSGGAKPVRVDKEGNQLKLKTSEWMKDLVNSFNSDGDARKKELEKARELAHQCAEMRIEAINKAMAEQEAATTKIVQTLGEKLKEVQAQLDRLQATEASSLDQKSKCEAAKKSVEQEFKLFKERCNKERDEAKQDAADKLQSTINEWTEKLAKCEKEAAAGGADAAKKYKEIFAAKEKAEEALKAEQAVNAKHLEEAKKQNAKFAKAIEDACQLLKDALK